MTKVLIVDDSPLVLTVLHNVLEQAGYHVSVAPSAAEALAKALEVQPEVVVTDSVMPGMDGFAFIHALRAEPATSRTPVIMLTSANPDDPQLSVREPRPDAFVSKSGDFRPLLAEIRGVLERLS